MLISRYTMKNTRSRRPDHVGGMGGDVCEPPNSLPEPGTEPGGEVYRNISKSYVFIYLAFLALAFTNSAKR